MKTSRMKPTAAGVRLVTIGNRVIWSLMALLTAVCVFPAAAAVELELEEAQYLSQRNELVVVSRRNYEPYEFMESAELKGINVELLRWIADDLGISIRFETAGSADLAHEMLLKGEADIISGMFVPDMHDPDIDFSGATKIALLNLYVRSDSSEITGIEDLEGRRVVVLDSDFSRNLLEDAGIECEILTARTTENAIERVASGEADAMLGNDQITQYHLYSSGRKDIRVAGTPLSAGRMCMGVRQGDDLLLSILDKSIMASKQSGELLAIESEWLGFGNRKKALPLKAILGAVGVFAGVMLTGLLWNILLRRKVAEKTRQFAESEARLRTIFENSPEAILLMERDGRIVLANEKSAELLGQTRETLMSSTVADVMPAAYHEQMEHEWDTWFSDGVHECTSSLAAPGGKGLMISLVGQVQQLDGRDVLQLFIRDITLRHRAEEKMRAARELAEESRMMEERARKGAEKLSQVQSEFLANLSRDIRTPLNDIVGMSQMLLDRPDEEEQENCVKIIERSSDGLLKTIDDVLEIATIESGQLEVQVDAFDLRELFVGIRQRYRETAQGLDISFKSKVAEEVPLYLIGDAKLLNRVLTNLVDNAMKYTAYGSVTLLAECSAKSKDGAELVFKVIDTGNGISKDKQAMIFDAHTTASPMEQYHSGRGLGLAVCKRQVELMGGSIGIESEEGEGTTVYFELCLPQSNHPVEFNVPERDTDKTVRNPGAAVLLVEDNKVNQKVVSTMLTKAGCKVTTADNGRDALLCLRNKKFDLVLMDCAMPVMDGFEATRQIRAMDGDIAKIPVVAITANAMKEDELKCLDSGMNDYIAKPVSRPVLIKKLNKYLKEKKPQVLPPHLDPVLKKLF
ncbi:response regulator [Pontiella sp.]|uniref:response regulator n=1 Tax=Pontiella sp. TaxID=2837462 RepID=UPI003564D5E0